MIQTSQRWKDTINSPYSEYRGLATIQISLGEAFVDNKLNVKTSSAQPTTKLNQLNDGELRPDYKYAALDGNWVLGDDKRLSSSIYMQTGFRGWDVSDASGNFTTPITFETTFESEKLIDQIDLSFDPLLEEYAVNFKYMFYADAQKTQLINAWTVTGNDQTMRLITADEMGTGPLTGVKVIVLSISKWSKPNTFAKVTENFGAREEGFTEMDRIMSVRTSYQTETTGSMDAGGVYASTLEVVLKNDDNYFTNTEPYNSPFIRNKRVDASFGIEYDDGTTEYVTAGVFYIDNLSEGADGTTVTINATDIMKEFSGKPYKKSAGMTYPATPARIFEDAIIATGLPIKYVSDSIANQYTIPTEPDWGQNVDCRQVLRFVAQCVNGYVRQDRNGTVHLYAMIGASATEPVDPYVSPVEDVGPNAYYTLSGRSSNVEGVTRVTISGANDTVVMRNDAIAENLVGTMDYPIINNPIFKAFPATSASLHAAAAINILHTYNYTTELRSMHWRVDPAIEPGDVLRLMTINGTMYKARVAQMGVDYQGGFDGQLSTRAQSVGLAIPDIRFYIEDGMLMCYVDRMFEPFFLPRINNNGMLIIEHSGPLENADFRIEDGYLIMNYG